MLNKNTSEKKIHSMVRSTGYRIIHTWLIPRYSETRNASKCWWALIKRAIRTGGVRSWKKQLYLVLVWRFLVVQETGNSCQQRTLNCCILRGMPISGLRTAFKTRNNLHISCIRSRLKLLPKPSGYHYGRAKSEITLKIFTFFKKKQISLKGDIC